jgi:hypothetical protein
MRRMILVLTATVCAGCIVQPPPPPPPVVVAPAPQIAGQDCREFTAPVTVNGQPAEATGEACLQPDGSWRVVQNTPGVAPPQVFVVPPPPEYYYAYPYPWWGLVDIGIGGAVVFRGGGRVGAWRGGWRHR